MAAERIDSLTGLRFFAAFGILIHHFGNSLAFGSSFWIGFLESLSSCVSFFFVLSGFILVHSYQAISQRLSWASFMLARIARIYPLYLLALLVMTVPFLRYPVELPDWKAWESIPAFLSSALALQAWIPRYSMLLNSPGWSLSAEIFFYAALPIIAWNWRKLLFDRPFRAMAIFWILSIATGLALEATVVGDRTVADSGAKLAGFHPLVRLPEFLMGMSLRTFYSNPSLTPRKSTALWISGASLLFIGLFVGSSGMWKTAFHNGLLAPLFAMIILGLSKAKDPFQSFLSKRWMCLLGESSYALYILHFPFMILLSSAIYRFNLSMTGQVKVFVYVALSIALSILAHLFIERPTQSALRKRFLHREVKFSSVKT